MTMTAPPPSGSTPVSSPGRVALVTGGAQGIGAGICEELAAVGIAVAIIDLNADKAGEVAARLTDRGHRATAIVVDIAAEAGCREAVARTVSAFGGLDILVNNAAPGRNRDAIGQITVADWATHEQVVLQATVHLVDAAVPYLSASGTGAVVNISSAIALRVALDHCSWSYHVSKAGLNHLTRWLASRLGAQGIRVNAVAPGLVDREGGPQLTDLPMHRTIIEAVVPLRRAGRASDVAKAVAFLCSDQSAYITGQVLVVDGGIDLSDVFGASLRGFQLAKLPGPE